MRRILNTTVAVGALLAAMPTSAQEATGTATPTVETGGIEEIVVTAQRRLESAQRAAIAIDVVGAAQLQNAGVVTPATLNATVPSLFVTKGGGSTTSYFIRGVGNFTNNGYTDPAVAFNVDGVYYGRPGSTVGTFFDLERIEVLKGPQGTLYGRNATGGAINVISAKPRADAFGGYASASYGNYNAVDLEAAVNAPLGAETALRISGKFIENKGYNDDGTSDEDGYAARIQLLTRPSPELTILLAADYAHNGGKGPGGSFRGLITTTPGTAATATSPANYTIVPNTLDPYSGLLSAPGRAYFAAQVLGGPRINPGPLNTPFQDNDFKGVHAEVNWETGLGTLTFLPAYRDSQLNQLFNGPAFRGGLIDEHDKQFSAELRLAGKRLGPVDWLIGAYYFDEKIEGVQTFSQYTVQAYQAFTNDTKSQAVFGRLTFNLSEQFRLVGAARYTKDEKDFVGNGNNVIQICTNPAGCFGGPSVPVTTSLAALGTLITIPTLPGPANSVAFGTTGNRIFYVPVPITGSLDRDKVTWRAAAEYDIAERSLLYASYETGYRSGGFNFTLGRPTYEPEFIKAATIGIKNRFLDNRLQLNVEAFSWKYSNQQVAHFGLDATGGSSFFSENIGRSKIKGIDIDVQFKASPTTLLRGSMQYLDNELTSFTYNTVRNTTTNALPPPVGCAATAGTAPIPGTATLSPVWVIDCSGKPGFNSPKLSFNGGVEQVVPVGSGLELTFNLDGRYRSNRVTSFEYLSFQNSGKTFTADASVKVGPADGAWAITGFVQNLTDKLVPVLSQFAGTTGNVIVTNYAPPRTFGLRGRVTF